MTWRRLLMGLATQEHRSRSMRILSGLPIPDCINTVNCRSRLTCAACKVEKCNANRVQFLPCIDVWCSYLYKCWKFDAKPVTIWILSGLAKLDPHWFWSELSCSEPHCTCKIRLSPPARVLSSSFWSMRYALWKTMSPRKSP